MYTQMEYEVDVEHFEQLRSQLRILFLAGQTPEGRASRDRLDGMEYKQQDNELERQITLCRQRLNFSKFQFAQRMLNVNNAKREKRENGFKRGRWRPCVDADQATVLRQRGYNTRCTGVKTWEVFD